MSSALGDRRRRLEGCLLGTAVGDALGLPCEGLSPAVVARRFQPLDRFRLVGRTGFVSDDTEQSTLVLEALCGPGGDDDDDDDDDDVVVHRFRRGLRAWFWRLPFGVGGLRRSGVDSAGNGAAMRSAVLGVAIVDPARRARLVRRLAEVTHTDPRAVAAAVFVAAVAAGDAHAVDAVDVPALKAALLVAVELANAHAGIDVAAATLGTSGFVLHSVPFAWFCLRRFGVSFEAVRQCIAGGGDADTNAAIVGGWVGALQPEEVPAALVGHLTGGPDGPTHLRALAAAVVAGAPAPRAWWILGLLRNLALYPVVLAHGFRRLLP